MLFDGARWNEESFSIYVFFRRLRDSRFLFLISLSLFFFLSALLRELGSLCWDRGYGAFESTRDAALLGSSRAGTDQTHVGQSGEAYIVLPLHSIDSATIYIIQISGKAFAISTG